MKRTTVFLPDHLKAALERAARAEGRSEADLIREGVQTVTERALQPAPRLPLFSSGTPDNLSERIDEILDRDFAED